MANIPWTYRVFFSVDLHKSTDYKRKILDKDSEEIAVWAFTFESFFEDFSQRFFSEFEKSTIKKPSIWKCLGDEIIFYVEINDSKDVNTYVTYLKNAIRGYNSISNKLKCQGTVWGAGFPIRNREILIPSTDEGSSQKGDFIGIDMDLGFRLSKYAKPDYMIISLPVAYILSLHCYESLRFYNKTEVKGIHTEYPVFWDSPSENPGIETNLYKICSHTEITNFCKAFFKGDSTVFFKPFIEKDASHKCDKIMPKMKELKKKVEELYDAANKKQPPNEPKNGSGSSKMPERLREIQKTSFVHQVGTRSRKEINVASRCSKPAKKGVKQSAKKKGKVLLSKSSRSNSRKKR